MGEGAAGLRVYPDQPRRLADVERSSRPVGKFVAAFEFIRIDVHRRGLPGRRLRRIDLEVIHVRAAVDEECDRVAARLLRLEVENDGPLPRWSAIDAPDPQRRGDDRAVGLVLDLDRQRGRDRRRRKGCFLYS